jgi:uncharacterized protein YhjY with autotransporter beta-barrel domain
VRALLVLALTAAFGSTALAQFTITLQPNSLPPATRNAAYSQIVTAVGGTAPYTFSISSGALPAGLSLDSAGNLTGTPTASGPATFQIQAIDNGGNGGFRTYNFSVGTPGSLGINPATLPDGFQNIAYNQLLTGTGGTGPYTFSVLSGSLPPGLSLASGGGITGTPSTGGSYTFTVGVVDSGGSTGSASFTINIGANILTVLPATLPNGTQNAAYSQTVTASGGTGPYTFAVTSGALPAGLSLDSAGNLTGTPTGSGPSTFTVTATDSASNTGSRSYTVNIGINSLTVTPAGLPNGSISVPYSQTLGANGGAPPYSFAVTVGAVPTGLSLSAGGVLSGTPTASGPFTFTVQASDPSFNTGTRSYTVTISATALAIAPATLPSGTQGTAYNQTVSASGGTGPYTYAVIAGALPAGLAFDTATGIISGTPGAPGSSGFTIGATDSLGNVGNRPYTVNIGTNSLTVSPATLPAAQAGRPYSQTVIASGGTAPYTYSIIVGALPAGLTLNPANGLISGTPTSTGAAAFTVQALDINGNTGSRAYAFTSRSNPATDPEVQALIAAQVATAQRFALAQVNNITHHLEELHDQFKPCSFNFGLSPPIEQAGPSGAPYGAYGNPNQLNSPYGNYAAPGANAQAGYSSPSRRPGQSDCAADWASSMSFWTSGAFQFGSMTPTGLVTGNRFSTAGVTAGVDMRVDDDLIVGAALGYGADRSDVGVNGSRSDAASFSGTLYASLRAADPLYLDAAIGYGTLGYKENRYVTDDGTTATGDRSGSYWFGALTASFELHHDAFKFAPYVRADFMSANLGAYAEQGASGGLLNYDTMKFNAMSGAVGLRGSIDIPVSYGTLTPTARIEFRQTSQSAYAQSMFYSDLGAGSSVVLNQPAGTYTLITGAVGLRARMAAGLSIGLEYALSQGSGSLLMHTVRGTLRVPF